MLSIVIPSYKNPTHLDLCLKSALEQQKYKNEIIVVVDGYLDLSQHVIDKYKDRVTFIPFEENRGMQMAINYGVWNATNDYVMVVAEDNVFPYHWDEVANSQKFIKHVLSFNQIEPTGPSIFKNFIIKDFGRTVSMFEYEKFIEYEKTMRNSAVTVYGGTFPFMLSKKAFMSVGGFDVLYASPHVCDWDFFLKLQLAGYSLSGTRSANFYHFGGKSTKHRDNMQEEFNTREFEAYEFFETKWGFKPNRNPDNNSYAPEQNIKGINFKNNN